VAVDAARGRVVVPCSGDGSVRVLDVQSGAVLRTVRVGPAAGAGLGLSGVAVDGRRERVLVLRGEAASVEVLNGHSGALLHTIAVGLYPLAVAIDEQAERAFVVNYGGVAPPPAAWWERAVQRLGLGLSWLAPRPPASARVSASVSVLDLGHL
jgi:DNA-binding beta-propeller fold protein YncE